MKKALLLLFFSFILVNCSSKKAVNEPIVQYRDDFKSVSEKSKSVFLSEMKATDKKYSVIILTKGFTGEDLAVTNETKQLYKGNPITNLGTGIAGYLRIENAANTKISDKKSKRELLLESGQTKKHKFIYVMKDNSLPNPYKITYSNTLRPLK
ncbi:hypothetical protein [Flavobacterium pedocola]